MLFLIKIIIQKYNMKVKFVYHSYNCFFIKPSNMFYINKNVIIYLEFYKNFKNSRYYTPPQIPLSFTKFYYYTSLFLPSTSIHPFPPSNSITILFYSHSPSPLSSQILDSKVSEAADGDDKEKVGCGGLDGWADEYFL